MPLFQRDYDQAARYLERAREILERTPASKARTIRDALSLAVARLSKGDQLIDNVPAEVTSLTDVSNQITEPEARTEIRKAIAVLRDRGNGKRY